MADGINLNLELDYKKAKSLIKTCILNKEPVMNWGPPGVGKSEMVQDIGRELGREVIDIRAGLFSEVDVKGYPFIDQDTKTMRFAISNEFPRDPASTAIMFLDEINAAMPSTMLALYQLILNRRVGEYVLPEGVAIVAAGNRETDRAGIFSMPKPLENRFVHVETTVSFNAWIDWAINNEIHKDVVAFLGKNQSKLLTFNPDTSARGFATPRSWAKVSRLLTSTKTTDENEMFNIVAGCVGVGLATEFIAFRKIIATLPDPMDILSRKVKTIDKVENGLCYAIVTNLLHTLREMTRDNNPKIDEYNNNFFEFLMENDKAIGPEFIAMSINAGRSTYKLEFNSKKTPKMMDAIKKYQVLLTGI